MNEFTVGCCSIVVIAVGFLGAVFGIGMINWETSEQIVSGIVYNNTNDNWLSGNTKFNIRASVDTYVNEQNTSKYCLPPNSPYIPLVKEAAKDKNIKVVVKTEKKFQILWPWQCMDNVTVEKEIK